jgi:lipopolysaccharide/colanic/teichoic acid biosynthesis glycosyltransferase
MYQYIKRIIDFSISLIGTIVLLPLIVLLSVLIKLDSKGPILFTQKRIGIHQKTFMIYKFRTMLYQPKDAPQFAQKNDTCPKNARRNFAYHHFASDSDQSFCEFSKYGRL